MSDPRAMLRTLIAATAAWQGLLGVEEEENAAELAADRIYLGGSYGEDANVFPHLAIGGTVVGDVLADGCVARHGELSVMLFVEYEGDLAAEGGPIHAASSALWSEVLVPLQNAVLALQGTVVDGVSYLILRGFEWDYQVLLDVREQYRVWRCQAVARWGIPG